MTGLKESDGNMATSVCPSATTVGRGIGGFVQAILDNRHLLSPVPIDIHFAQAPIASAIGAGNDFRASLLD